MTLTALGFLVLIHISTAHSTTSTTMFIKDIINSKSLPRTPFWFMRQAGRYLPEYRELSAASGGFLNTCYSRDLAAQITIQPITRFDMDAAIIFSDILVIPDSFGMNLRFVKDKGPELDGILDLKHLDRLRNTEQSTSNLYQTYGAISIVKDRLPHKELIGFFGAPWTLAVYMLEGEGGGSFGRVRSMLDSDPGLLTGVVEFLIDPISEHLIKQIQFGATAVQIFDSWASLLAGRDQQFFDLVIEPTRRIVQNVKSKFPDIGIIGFPRGSSNEYLINYALSTGIDVISLGTEVDLRWAAKNIPSNVKIQGGIDPLVLLRTKEEISIAVDAVFSALPTRGFVFNLGHGISKDTPLENMYHLVSLLNER